MQNYSSRFKIKQLPKNDIDSSDSNILPSAVILFFLLGNQDENIAKVVKKIIQKNGTVSVQGLPTSIENKVKPSSSKIDSDKLQANTDSISNVFRLRRPFNLPELKEAKFEGRDLLVKFQLSNVQVVDLGPFITKEKRDVGSLFMDLNTESLSLFVQYSINGHIHGESFNHSGKTDIYLSDIDGTVQVDYATDIANGTTEISNLNLHFDFKYLEFGRTGLSIKRLPVSELQRILNLLGKMYLKQNMKNASAKLSESVKNQTNSLLENKNRDQLVQFLEKHLNVLRRGGGTIIVANNTENKT